MCLAFPMRIKKIEKDTALVESDGLGRRINIQFLKNVKIGDYIIVHAGFAIEKIDEKRAGETLGLFNEVRRRI